MSKIGVIGTGYVGLVSGSCLADFGHEVVCVDVDQQKVNELSNGKIPIYEPGLEELVNRNIYYKRIGFTTDLISVIQSCDILFVAVGTPPAYDGSADLTQVLSVAESIAEHMNGYKIIVNKSTVPVGTGHQVRELIGTRLKERGVNLDFDVVSNPEFLREGSAVYDFTHPDRIVVGADTEQAAQHMKDIYKVLYINETPFVITNIETAEMIKYASNAFLAMKITYINEIANICEKVGANVQDVAKAMGKDGRISPKFLHAGPGYGGSCFPKDTRALADIARKNHVPITLIEATIEANERQKQRMVDKIIEKMGPDLKGKTIAVLGITFKPNTDDLREAPALVIIPRLIECGAMIQVFDPAGHEEGQWRFKDNLDSIDFRSNEYEALADADALVILTEWNHFRSLDFKRARELMKGTYFFDFRNIYSPEDMTSLGFEYTSVGR